ncbi:MAG: iron-sulfur cluster assembly protein [Bacteroidales bacterium]|jgi:FeS assembly SUF system protein|nr:iron-sulfur cluster assembly protein [Bacteroidales bacterium]
MNLLKDKIINKLKAIFDPEIPVSIWELGFIYDVIIKDDFDVEIVMTLTAPNCPVAESLPEEVKNTIASIDEVNNVKVTVTFDPPWTMDKMSDEAKLDLGFL